ncbi:hypothetical protein PROFUN_07420, partial [Planoprotostelium fungivorum]
MRFGFSGWYALRMDHFSPTTIIQMHGHRPEKTNHALDKNITSATENWLINIRVYSDDRLSQFCLQLSWWIKPIPRGGQNISTFIKRLVFCPRVSKKAAAMTSEACRVHGPSHSGAIRFGLRKLDPRRHEASPLVTNDKRVKDIHSSSSVEMVRSLLFLIVAACALAACPPGLPSGTVNWSSIADWNKSNASITIPQGTTVVLDASPSNAVGVIRVNGVLYILDGTLSLTTEGIVVGPTGKLFIGTKDCPVTKKVIITLVAGAALGTDAYDSTKFGVKGIVAAWGGVIQMFGFTSGPSWTRLASNALQGSRSVQLQQPVSWTVGDSILIASTDFSEVMGPSDPIQMKGNVFPDQHETRKIISLSSDKKTITLDSPLTFNHWGQGIERAEVGLLTKRIVIQGDVSSDGNSIGGHMMLRYGTHLIQGVELIRMGQRGSVGRYPIHFHMARFLWGMNVMVTDSSIHDCYQRCVSVHETHGVTLRDNIGYNTFGHCWFLEDGGEHGNAFVRNWAARVKPMDTNPLLLSDTEASGFWISNPNNTFIDNAVSGAFIGFWFVMPVQPLRLSAKFWPDLNVMNPRRTSLPPNGFRGNVIHTIYQDGIQCSNMESDDLGTMTAGGWSPTSGAPFSDNMKVPLVFSDVTVYKTRGPAVWTRGCSPSTWKNIIVADFGRGFDAINDQTAVNWTFVGRSDNKGVPNTNIGISVPSPRGDILPIGGITHYDVGSGLTVVDSTFINFTDPNVPYGAWAGSTNGPGWDSPPNWLSLNSTMINSNAVAFPLWFGDYTFQSDGILDDGVKGGAYMVGLMPAFAKMPECTYKAAWPGYQCNWFAYGYSHVRLSGDSIIFTPEKSDTTAYKMDYTAGVGVVNRFSKNIIGMVPMGSAVTDIHFLQSMSDGPAYYNGMMNGGLYEILAFNTSGHVFQSFGGFQMTLGQCTKANSWAIFSVSYPQNTTFKIVTTFVSIPAVQHTAVGSFAELNWNTYYYNANEQKLYFLIASDSDQWYMTKGGGEYYYKTPFNTGQYTTIMASCGTNCRRAGKATIASKPSSLPIAVRHDLYKVRLTGSNDAAGTAFLQFYPSYRNTGPRLSYQLYHNLKGLDYAFCLAVNDKCVSAGLTENILGVSWIVPLTRRLWDKMATGGLYLMAKSVTKGNTLLSGALVMQNSDGKVWAPADASEAGGCSTSYEVLPIYNGTSKFNRFSDAGSYKDDDTSSVKCDGRSLTFINTNPNSNNIFGFSDMNLQPLASKFVSVEFFAKTFTPNTAVNLQMSVQNTWGGAYTSVNVKPYGSNYLVDDEWSFFRVPLSAFNTNN